MVALLYLISGPDTRLVLVMMTQSFPVSPCEEFLMSPGHHDLSASASIVGRMEVEVDIIYLFPPPPQHLGMRYVPVVV